MRKKSMLTSAIVFMIMGVVLIIIKQWEAGVIAISFATISGLGVLVILFMDRLDRKKLDSNYFVRRKEFLLKDYEKLTKDFNKGKLKSLSLVTLKLTKEHDPETLKYFGMWLKEAFPTDPKGYDEGIIILYVNIHESLMDELIKQMRKRLKELRLGVSFKYGYTYYTGTESYETLRNLAEEAIK